MRLNEAEAELGVSGKKYTEQELKKIYRQLAKKWHPDLYTDATMKEKANAKICKINEAYKLLTEYLNGGGNLKVQPEKTHKEFTHGNSIFEIIEEV